MAAQPKRGELRGRAELSVLRLVPGTLPLCPRGTLGLSVPPPSGYRSTLGRADGQAGPWPRQCWDGWAVPLSRLRPLRGQRGDPRNSRESCSATAPEEFSETASYPSLGFLVRERATVESNGWGDFVEIEILWKL